MATTGGPEKKTAPQEPAIRSSVFWKLRKTRPRDPARKQLVWRGSVTKTLHPGKDPDKNYKNLEKAIAKLLKNYPPKPGK